MNLTDRYYLRLAVAYIRGELPELADQYPETLSSLEQEVLEKIFYIGKDKGLKVHRFKKTMPLPRISKSIGILLGIQPSNLLDIGTGRGVFLIPLLEAIPALAITCIDLLDHRIATLESLKKGGIGNITRLKMNTTKLSFEAEQFDMVTALEVLEHIEQLEQAIGEICRVARRHILFSVPSKEDDNPEHIHLLTLERLQPLFSQNGFGRIKASSVHNHLLGLVTRR